MAAAGSTILLFTVLLVHLSMYICVSAPWRGRSLITLGDAPLGDSDRDLPVLSTISTSIGSGDGGGLMDPSF